MIREEAIKFYADEVRFLEAAHKINTHANDAMKEEWKRQAEIHRTAIAALKELPGWIGVDEAMPEDNQKVLVCTRSGKICVARWSERQGHFVASGNLTVTHWIQLPEPPEEEV